MSSLFSYFFPPQNSQDLVEDKQKNNKCNEFYDMNVRFYTQPNQLETPIPQDIVNAMKRECHIDNFAEEIDALRKTGLKNGRTSTNDADSQEARAIIARVNLNRQIIPQDRLGPIIDAGKSRKRIIVKRKKSKKTRCKVRTKRAS